MFKDSRDENGELPLWVFILVTIVPLFVLAFLYVRNRNRMQMRWAAERDIEFPLEGMPSPQVPQRAQMAEEAPAVEKPPETPTTAETEERIVEEPAAQVEPSAVGQNEPLDDLKVIEGIGPKIQEVLYGSGIKNFRQLAEVPVDRLREILSVARMPGDPGTWPEQAALAAEGRWDDLVSLQKELKGGRRVG